LTFANVKNNNFNFAATTISFNSSITKIKDTNTTISETSTIINNKSTIINFSTQTSSISTSNDIEDMQKKRTINITIIARMLTTKIISIIDKF